MPKFVYGSHVYDYDLLRQSRKTLSLTVMPDLQIILKVPYAATDERIELFLKRKWLWLEKQLSSLRRYQRKSYKKEYVTGESLHFLGRQYLLHIKRAQEEKIVITKGKMILYTVNKVSNVHCNERLITNWYLKQRRIVFTNRLKLQIKNFEITENVELVIRDMQRRWGSYTKGGKIILNKSLIFTSTACIDYVIAHELCHITYKNHDKKFYKLLEERFPRWEKVKKKLELYEI